MIHIIPVIIIHENTDIIIIVITYITAIITCIFIACVIVIYITYYITTFVIICFTSTYVIIYFIFIITAVVREFYWCVIDKRRSATILTGLASRIFLSVALEES